MTTVNTRTVPVSSKNYKKASAFDLSDTGYRRFFPWFLANRNPASVDEYFNVVMDILPTVDKAVRKREYWFFRGDVNIVMAWFRVFFCLSVHLPSPSRWCGVKKTS